MSPAKDLLVHLGWETVLWVRSCQESLTQYSEDVVLYLCFTSQFSAFVIVLTGIGPSARLVVERACCSQLTHRPLERTIGLATILTSFAALALLVETGVYLSADTDTLIAILLFLLAILALILVALNGMYSVVNRCVLGFPGSARETHVDRADVGSSSGDINLV